MYSRGKPIYLLLHQILLWRMRELQSTWSSTLCRSQIRIKFSESNFGDSSYSRFSFRSTGWCSFSISKVIPPILPPTFNFFIISYWHLIYRIVDRIFSIVIGGGIKHQKKIIHRLRKELGYEGIYEALKNHVYTDYLDRQETRERSGKSYIWLGSF